MNILDIPEGAVLGPPFGVGKRGYAKIIIELNDELKMGLYDVVKDIIIFEPIFTKIQIINPYPGEYLLYHNSVSLIEKEPNIRTSKEILKELIFLETEKNQGISKGAS